MQILNVFNNLIPVTFWLCANFVTYMQCDNFHVEQNDIY